MYFEIKIHIQVKIQVTSFIPLSKYKKLALEKNNHNVDH